MKSWPVQDAKARFSEMLDTCLQDGPQVVTRRGVDAAVLVPAEEWHRLQALRTPTLKDWLLTDFARGEMEIPERRGYTLREPPTFDD